MTEKNLKQKISEGLLFLDGAIGTQIMARGIKSDKCNEMLNVESPQVIEGIHRSYFDAGSDAVYTNTFGANEISLARHNLAGKLQQINQAAVKIARQAAENKYVIGDIGPSGEFLKPLGSLEPITLKNAYTKQIKTLYQAGVDGFVIETFMAINEAEIIVEAVKSVCDLPVFVSFAFDSKGSDFKTMMGASPQAIVDEFSALKVDAIGFNCGTLQMEQYLELTQQFAKLLKGKNTLLLAKPNGGKPELADGRAVYKLLPQNFADYADKIHKAGAALLGGCCGTSPEHIKAMTEKVKNKI